jgi:hypothetical protein
VAPRRRKAREEVSTAIIIALIAIAIALVALRVINKGGRK